MASKDQDDERIKKITEMLEKGGTMLATHHECGAPMFRYQGKIVCPVCISQEFKKKEAEKKTADVKSAKGQEETDRPSIELSIEHSEIEGIIIKKIVALSKALEDENDSRRILEELECIEKGLAILKLLKK